jgi:hypothetical protein
MERLRRLLGDAGKPGLIGHRLSSIRDPARAMLPPVGRLLGLSPLDWSRKRVIERLIAGLASPGRPLEPYLPKIGPYVDLADGQVLPGLGHKPLVGPDPRAP